MSVIDPVCGMEMDEEDVGAVLKYGGETFSFCSVECRDEFTENADEYAGVELDEEGAPDDEGW